jgi:hypothetical protein
LIIEKLPQRHLLIRASLQEQQYALQRLCISNQPLVELRAGQRMDVSWQDDKMLLIHCPSDAPGDVRRLCSGTPEREDKDGNKVQYNTTQTCLWESHGSAYATDSRRTSVKPGDGGEGSYH